MGAATPGDAGAGEGGASWREGGGAGGFLAATVLGEPRKPAREPTWHGLVAGVVPKDLRPLAAGRLRERLWNPAGPLVGPQALGVGRSLNLGALARRLALA